MMSFLRSPYFFTILPPLFWAGNAIVGRAVVNDMTPFQLSFFRWLLALIILLPFGLPRLKIEWPKLKGRWGLVAFLSLLSVTAYNTLLYIALRSTTATNATLVGASMPVMIAILSMIWLKEKTKPLQSFGIVLSLLGVLAVISHGAPESLLSFQFATGDLIMVIATLDWAIYSVMLRRYPTGLDPLAFLTIQLIFGVAFIAPLYAFDYISSGPVIWTPSLAAIILYVGLFSSLAAYYFWDRGVAHLGPTIAGLYANLIPVFTALLAVLFLGEEFRWFHAVGLTLIVSGISLTTLRPKTAKAR